MNSRKLRLSGNITDNNNKNNKNNIQFKGLCEIFLLYFDEVIGHVPLLICPDESVKEDKEKMRLINMHSIWFLDIKKANTFDRVDLEYGGKVYFAKKFLIPSKRKKRRSGLENENFETIIIIVALPTDLDIFGGALLKQMTKTIIKNFETTLSYLIESEVLKYEIIKTSNIKEIIKEGELIKNQLKHLIEKTCNEYFSSVIKQTDATSLKMQKAISFLSFKGIDFTYIISEDEKVAFSNIRLFDSDSVKDKTFEIKTPFIISSINIIEHSQEIEIIVKNMSKKDINNLIVEIIYVKEFFEKEILNQKIDLWFQEEELSILSPILPYINEYFFFIFDESLNKKLFSKKIDLNTLDTRF